MDYFFEGSSSEDHEYDKSASSDTEAALYSLLHHSQETYESNDTTLLNLVESERNKALRFQRVHDLPRPCNYFGEFPNSIERNVEQDYFSLEQHTVSDNLIAVQNRCQDERKPWQKEFWKHQNNRFVNTLGLDGNNVNTVLSENVKNSREGSSVEGEHNNAGRNKEGSTASQQLNSDGAKSKEIHDTFSPIQNSSVIDVEIVEEKDVSVRAQAKSPNKRIHSENNNDYLNPNKKIKRTKESKLLAEQNTLRSKCLTSTSPSCSSNLSKSKNNVQKYQEIVIDDTSESDGSVIELLMPPKPDPLLISLDNETDLYNVLSDCVQPMLNISTRRTEEITLISKNQTTVTTSTKSLEIIKSDNCLLPDKDFSPKRKKKKRVRKKLKESRQLTKSMVEFYNLSWGGETFDHVKLQQKMTSNPSKWKILDSDKYGPIQNHGPLARIRCDNCHQCGHIAHNCPDPPKKIKCFMCGQQGHIEYKCPNKVCLKCGRPAPLYRTGCPSCWSKDHPINCSTCGDREHFAWMCPNAWRKLHSVTSPEGLSSPHTPQFKQSIKQACCFCAQSGHSESQCPVSLKHKQQEMNAFVNNPFIPKKWKRKLSNSYGWKKHHENYKKKRRTF